MSAKVHIWEITEFIENITERNVLMRLLRKSRLTSLGKPTAAW